MSHPHSTGYGNCLKKNTSLIDWLEVSRLMWFLHFPFVYAELGGGSYLPRNTRKGGLQFKTVCVSSAMRRKRTSITSSLNVLTSKKYGELGWVIGFQQAIITHHSSHDWNLPANRSGCPQVYIHTAILCNEVGTNFCDLSTHNLLYTNRKFQKKWNRELINYMNLNNKLYTNTWQAHQGALDLIIRGNRFHSV